MSTGGPYRHLFTVDFFATQGGVLTDKVNISYVNLFFQLYISKVSLTIK